VRYIFIKIKYKIFYKVILLYFKQFLSNIGESYLAVGVWIIEQRQGVAEDEENEEENWEEGETIHILRNIL